MSASQLKGQCSDAACNYVEGLEMKRGFLLSSPKPKHKQLLFSTTPNTDPWSSQLPQHILDLIPKKIDTLDDLIRFSWVCKTWRLSALPFTSFKPFNKPWLIVPYTNDHVSKTGTACDKTLGFFDLSTRKLYKVDLPEIANHRICGSCRGGWLVTVNSFGDIQLLHPFARKVISLAPVTALPGVVSCYYNERQNLVYDVKNYGSVCTIASNCMREFYIYKAVMLPCAGVVMVIHGLNKMLAFCKVSDENKKWISVEGCEGNFNDVTIFKGEFYAVKHNGSVYVVCGGFDTSLTPFVKFVIGQPVNWGYYKKYLVEARGELFLLDRIRYQLQPGHDEADRTLVFSIKKIIDLNGKIIELNEPKFVSVDYIGKDCAVFVGWNDSFARLTSDVPDCKGNSIYFTDDFVDGVSDMNNVNIGSILENFVNEPIGRQDIGAWDMKANVLTD
ncbi:hypothetical protein IFM89_021526 [Coptis chinensis]|uniref:KIB1-4 beta-propeller domain-containing protein n=1 Tax=Coptis chinensis TaxID=261450 RepID=A0A835IQ49_9MAGN|nr:hypothetical protein IFM89_021526 [Coptis chinensis]